MGLENLIPSISLAMAVASNSPIQMGSACSPSISFKITIGLLVMGSTVIPDTTMGLYIISSEGGLSIGFNPFFPMPADLSRQLEDVDGTPARDLFLERVFPSL
jgi:hypothetical protein